MNKEEGNFYTFGEHVGKARIRSLPGEDGASLFYILATSLAAKSEVVVTEIAEADFSPAVLATFRLDLILTDAVILRTKHGHLLFGIGYESEEKLGKESVYFTQEIDWASGGQKADVTLRPTLKSKKISFTGLVAANDCVFLTSAFEVYRFSLAEMKLEVCFEAPKKKWNGTLGPLKFDAKSKRVFLGQKNSLLVFDETFQPVASIDKAHDNVLSCVDVNVNKNGQLLTCANEPFLKFWDLRNPAKPNLVYDDHNTLLCQAAFNSFYDQLVLSSAFNGSISIFSANSISSSVLLRTGDERQVPENRVLKTFESALDDHVNSVAWSAHDAWIFAAGAANKVYFDLLPQKIKFETMF